MNLRDTARAALPAGAFLKRDRGGAMYITNAPAMGWSGEIEGFRVETEGGMARLYITSELMQKCDFAPDALARELLRFTGASDESTALFARCMKCAEAPEAAGYAKCDRLLRQAAAAALREGGGDGLYYCALALAEAGRRLNEMTNGGK